MKSYSLSHLSDSTLTSALASAATREQACIAELVAHIAEFDARGLYRGVGYPSMHLYCEAELRLSRDAAFRRITAARLARRFPLVFEGLADGRLHLSAVSLLSPHLEEAPELLEASFHKTKDEIERLIATRFPCTELIPLVESIPAPSPSCQSSRVMTSPAELVPGRVATAAEFVRPSAPQRFEVRFSMGQEMNEDLRAVQALIGNADLGEVFHRGLKLLRRKLEKQKYGLTDRSRVSRLLQNRNPRFVPAEIRRAVARRDGFQCTFVSEAGHRCSARQLLEFDHIQPVARGGSSSVSNLRLRCRAHNQYEADRTYGVQFMRARRDEAKARAEVAKEQAQELIGPLRRLGFSAEESRRAATSCTDLDAPLEQRIRAALRYLVPPNRASASTAM